MKVLKREVEVTQKLGVSVSHKTQLPRASRAGTRGFRAPEILLKVQRQTSGTTPNAALAPVLTVRLGCDSHRHVVGRRHPPFDSESSLSIFPEQQR